MAIGYGGLGFASLKRGKEEVEDKRGVVFGCGDWAQLRQNDVF